LSSPRISQRSWLATRTLRFVRYSISVQASGGRLSLGASWATTFLRVILPNIVPGMLGGGLFAFIASFDEIVIALFIAGPRFTLPKKMFDTLRTEVDPSIAAVSTLLIGLSGLVVLIVTLWLGRSLASVLGGLTGAQEGAPSDP